MNGTIFTNSMRNELPSTVRNSFALHQLKIYVKDELLSLFEITAPNYSNKRVKCLKKLCTSSNIHMITHASECQDSQNKYSTIPALISVGTTHSYKHKGIHTRCHKKCTFVKRSCVYMYVYALKKRHYTPLNI